MNLEVSILEENTMIQRINYKRGMIICEDNNEEDGHCLAFGDDLIAVAERWQVDMPSFEIKKVYIRIGERYRRSNKNSAELPIIEFNPYSNLNSLGLSNIVLSACFAIWEKINEINAEAQKLYPKAIQESNTPF